nr:hypothetical protein BaRGS_004146 [Batillaria attramentaria]
MILSAGLSYQICLGRRLYWVKGWLPWIGCAVEFGKEPVYFIDAKRKEVRVGPVFTLVVAGERMTFLTEPEDFAVFFQSEHVDFQMAVQSPVQRVVTEKSFFTYHTKIHDTVKGKLAATKLPALFPKLQHSFGKGLDEIVTPGEYDLHAVVRNVMYRGVIDNLFGNGVLPTQDVENFKVLEKHFVTFDDQFEEWSASKAWLLNLFRGVVQQLDAN